MYLYIVINTIYYTIFIIVKARCSTNTGNRGKVKYHQRTGSQSYIVQANPVVSRWTSHVFLCSSFHEPFYNASTLIIMHVFETYLEVEVYC
jgi:hypothetical protein